MILTVSESPPVSRLGNLWWVLLVGSVAAALCLPFLHAIYWLGDEGVLLHGATRILEGKRLYSDFFEFLPPGGFVLTAVWFKVAGISIVSARSLAIATIVGIACFTYLACQRAARNAPLAGLFAIGWVVMSQGAWTVVEHHWFTTLFSMIAMWAALAGVEPHPHRLRWPLIAGAAAGTAAMVTPTRGAFAMIAASLAFLHPRQRPTESMVYLVGCALVPLGIVSYLVMTGAVLPAFDDVIRFTATRYAPIQSVPFGAGWTPQNHPLLYLFPAAALLLALVYALGWRISRGDRQLQLCAAFACAGFLGCFPRPSIIHIAFAAPLALPLVVLCMTRLARYLPALLGNAALAVMILLVLVVSLRSADEFQFVVEQSLGARLVWTPRGQVAMHGYPGFPQLLQQIAATPPGEAYFFYPYMPMMPFLTARNDVAPYDIYVPSYTLPSQYQNACVSVMKHASWIVVDRKWTDARFLATVFPAMRKTQPPETSQFEQALDSAFELVARDGSFELRRSASADPSRCADIAE
jgi:hypothetical protein